MIKKIIKTTLFLTFIYISSLSAETIHITSIDWGPFYGSKLKKDGVVSEIAREALKRSGHTVKYKYMPWARSLSQAARGKKYHALMGCWYKK